jgi:hypothetical protein
MIQIIVRCMIQIIEYLLKMNDADHCEINDSDYCEMDDSNYCEMSDQYYP